MLNSLKKIFQSPEGAQENNNEDLHLLCGLMIEAANVDGKVDQKEVNLISKVLIETFHEDPSAVELELHKCLDEIEEHKSLHSFTSRINKTFSDQKKLLLLEVLWEIVLEDGEMHEFETNLIRRLAGLLYISDISCGNAKKRVIMKFQKKRLD